MEQINIGGLRDLLEKRASVDEKTPKKKEMFAKKTMGRR